MCSNFRPVTHSDQLLKFFGVVRDKDDLALDVWPTGSAPFIRLPEPRSGNKLIDDDLFES